MHTPRANPFRLFHFVRTQAQACARSAKQAYDEVVQANWKTPQNIKEQYSSASICGNHRVVFNIAGNKYRLVVEMQYRAGIAWVKFIGTHARYDQIDVESVNEY